MERAETQKKILEIGKKEFLEKGFKDASLNQIVAEAGFTKGAFYGYYPDKTALFEDLVGETAKELLTRFKAAQDDYFDLVPEGRAKDSLELSTQHLHELVAFMYDHFSSGSWLAPSNSFKPSLDATIPALRYSSTTGRSFSIPSARASRSNRLVNSPGRENWAVYSSTVRSKGR